VDADAAEKLVTDICVVGVQNYNTLEDKAEIRFRLTSALYHHLKHRLWFCTPNTDTLPVPLQALTGKERLIIAMRVFTGLTAAESGHILGLTPGAYRKQVTKSYRNPEKCIRYCPELFLTFPRLNNSRTLHGLMSRDCPPDRTGEGRFL